jgi:pyruvate kinase
MGNPTYGTACVVEDPAEADELLSEGDILVVKKLEKAYIKLLDRVSGIIAEEKGLTSQTAVECISQGVPLVTGAEGATEIIKSGILVTINTRNGVVYSGKANVV